MILFYLGQVPAQWFTEAGDTALAGGVLKFFEVGTSNPKAVYSDYQRVTAAGTTVTLDASGRANVFLDGLYSVQLFDANAVQIGPTVDGIGNAAMIGDGTTLVLETYDDMRGFDGDDFRAAVLQGRAANGDGGAGLFVWDALETTADDDGTILAPSTLPLSGRWVRVRGETVDPRWYGCKMDGTTADDTQLAIAFAASATLKARLHFEGGYSRVTSNTTIPTDARVSCGEAAGITATGSTVTLTIPAGVIFAGSAACFGGTLQPLFAGIDTPVIPFSWMGGASFDSMLDKWAAASGIAGQTYLLDKHSSGIIPTFLAGRHLDVVPGCVMIVNALAQSIDIDVVVPDNIYWLNWGPFQNIGTVNIGYRYCPVEWFGAVGDGITDDGIPLVAAFKSGWAKLGFGKYLLGSDINITALRLDGMLSNACGDGIFSGLSTMPASSLIMASDKTITSSLGIDLDSVGVYCSGGYIAVAMTQNFSAKNCVLGCFDGATITAGRIDTQDCYANSSLIFQTSTGETTFYSNLRTNSYPDRRMFRRGTALSEVYHLNEVGTSSLYDIVLTADNDDGLEDGKTSLTLDSVIAESISFKKITTGSQKNVDLTGLDATYTVLDSDPATIIFSPGAADKVVTLPATAGVTCKIRFFVCNYTTNDAQISFSGDLIDANFTATPSLTFSSIVRTAIFIDALGKWAM